MPMSKARAIKKLAYDTGYKKRPEVIARSKEYQRTYAIANKDRRNMLARERAMANPEKARLRQTTWRKKNPELTLKYAKEWQQRNSGYRRKYTLAQYGLDEQSYTDMLIKQAGNCAICGRSPKQSKRKREGDKTLHVDHCHVTKAVRGLLCYNCNLGVGNFQNDPNILRKAIKYLDNR